MQEARQCSGCGLTYPPHLVATAFDPNRKKGIDASIPMHRKRICRACVNSAKDIKKRENRWPKKAQDTIRRHADRLGIPKHDLIDRYGWDSVRLAHEAEHAYGNGCGYCGDTYAAMGHGFSDITLDIIDRSKPPYYLTNTKWCCQTCNRKKGVMTPEAFELDLQMWRWRNEQIAALRSSPQDFGRLFFLEAS